MLNQYLIGVVIPCYKVRPHILQVIDLIGPEVSKIYVVDDACPHQSGAYVSSNCKDKRVQILTNGENLGVGGAVMEGYKAAISDRMDVIVKIDGDGQMDPGIIPMFITPIINGRADYTKGNRFFNLEDVASMPKIRIIGNAALSFITKLSSGYWNIFDPTNGYTAIHSTIARSLPFEKISYRYFFESDMLFRLNTLQAVVMDIPIVAKYGDEISGLRITMVIGEFLVNNYKNFIKRIFYNYYLRDMSLGSVELPLGVSLMIFGLFFGIHNWIFFAREHVSAPTGTIMLSVLPLLIGLQLILAFLAQDIASTPKIPMHLILNGSKNIAGKQNEL